MTAGAKAGAAVGPTVLLVVAIVGLLALGRLLVNVFPVSIVMVGEGSTLTIGADGSASQVTLARPIVAVRPVGADAVPAGVPGRRLG